MNILKTTKHFGFIAITIFLATACAEEQLNMATGFDGTVISPELVENERAIEKLEGDIKFLRRAPRSVELFKLENDSLLFMFAEKMNYTLKHDLKIDLSEPGDYFPDSLPGDKQTWEALHPAVIPAGTKVSSYYFHYDNKTYNDDISVRDYFNCIGQYRVNAKVTFNKPVLGIVMRAGLGPRFHLLLSDKELGLPWVDYCEHNFRHFPGINIADGCQSDRFILSEDRKTLYLRNNTDVHHDNYRVILAAD